MGPTVPQTQLTDVCFGLESVLLPELRQYATMVVGDVWASSSFLSMLPPVVSIWSCRALGTLLPISLMLMHPWPCSPGPGLCLQLPFSRLLPVEPPSSVRTSAAASHLAAISPHLSHLGMD